MNFLKSVGFVGLLMSCLLVCSEKKVECYQLLQHKQSGKIYRVVAAHAHTLLDGRMSMCLYYVPFVASVLTDYDKKTHGEICYKNVLVSSCEYIAHNFDDVSHKIFHI